MFTTTPASRPRGRLVVLLLAFATLLALGVGTATSASAARPQPAADALATFTATATNGTPVTGVVDVNRFVAQADGTLAAVGTATVTNPATGQSATRAVTLPVDLAASTGSCEILDLVLGPLDLNLLGLVIHLDQVHLNITAQQGPGNLLGNLLCAVAGLLDGSTGLTDLLNGITALLNQILGALG